MWGGGWTGSRLVDSLPGRSRGRSWTPGRVVGGPVETRRVDVTCLREGSETGTPRGFDLDGGLGGQERCGWKVPDHVTVGGVSGRLGKAT